MQADGGELMGPVKISVTHWQLSERTLTHHNVSTHVQLIPPPQNNYLHH